MTFFIPRRSGYWNNQRPYYPVELYESHWLRRGLTQAVLLGASKTQTERIYGDLKGAGIITGLMYTPEYAVFNGSDWVNLGTQNKISATGYTLTFMGYVDSFTTYRALIMRDYTNGVRCYQTRTTPAGKFGFIRFDSSNSVLDNFESSATIATKQRFIVSFVFKKGSGSYIYLDGKQVGSSTSFLNTDNNVQSSGEPTYIGRRTDAGPTVSLPLYGGASVVTIHNIGFDSDQIYEYHAAAYNVFKKRGTQFYIATSAVKTAVGALVCGAASNSASALKKLSALAALASAQAAQSGSAVKSLPALGAVAAGESLIAGQGNTGSTAQGAVGAGTASVAGVADRRVDASGTIEAQVPSASGSAGLSRISSGSPSAASAAVSGSAARDVAASGAPSAQAPAVSAAAVKALDASAAIVAQTPTVSAAAVKSLDASGAAVAQTPIVAGTATHSANPSATGAVSTGSVAVAGQSVKTISAQAAVASAAGQISANGIKTVITSGAVIAADAQLSGIVERLISAVCAAAAGSGAVAGTASKNSIKTSVGSLVSATATFSGGVLKTLKSDGGLISDLSTIDALALRAVSGSGAAAANASGLSGQAAVIGVVTAAGVLVTDFAFIEGVAISDIITPTPASRVIMIPAHDRKIVIPVELLDFYL